MEDNYSRERLIHHIMTVEGGFLGTYAICSYGGHFASAQTGNLMDMVILFVVGDPVEALYRVAAFIIFCFSMAAAHVMSAACDRKKLQYLSIIIDALALAATMLLPWTIPHMVWLFPIFFASAFQWGIFGQVGSWPCPSIFTTGNLKNCVTAWTSYLVLMDRAMKDKAVFFTITVLCFVAGALAGAVCVYRLDKFSALAGFVPLAAAAAVISASSEPRA